MKLSKIKKGTPVEVRWIDAETEADSWQAESEVDTSSPHITSVGHFFKATKATLVLYADQDSRNGNVHTVLRIPMVAVERVRVLKQAD